MYGKAAAGVTTAAGAAGGGLAVTGAHVGYWVAAGLTLVVAGVALVGVFRRTGRRFDVS
jgi:hypothetical protein